MENKFYWFGTKHHGITEVNKFPDRESAEEKRSTFDALGYPVTPVFQYRNDPLRVYTKVRLWFAGDHDVISEIAHNDS